MLMTASQELALACIGIDPAAIDEARLSVEEAERLIEFDPSPWSRFTIAHARESVEDAEGNSAGAADARAVALRYYGEYRDAGGQPQRRRPSGSTKSAMPLLKAGVPTLIPSFRRTQY
jgi:hypothetical protein